MPFFVPLELSKVHHVKNSKGSSSQVPALAHFHHEIMQEKIDEDIKPHHARKNNAYTTTDNTTPAPAHHTTS